MGDLYEYARWKIKIIFCTYYCWVFRWVLADDTKSKNNRATVAEYCQLSGWLTCEPIEAVWNSQPGSQFLPYHTMALLKLCWNIVYRVFFFCRWALFLHHPLLCYDRFDWYAPVSKCSCTGLWCLSIHSHVVLPDSSLMLCWLHCVELVTAPLWVTAAWDEMLLRLLQPHLQLLWEEISGCGCREMW